MVDDISDGYVRVDAAAAALLIVHSATIDNHAGS